MALGPHRMISRRFDWRPVPPNQTMGNAGQAHIDARGVIFSLLLVYILSFLHPRPEGSPFASTTSAGTCQRSKIKISYSEQIIERSMIQENQSEGTLVLTRTTQYYLTPPPELRVRGHGASRIRIPWEVKPEREYQGLLENVQFIISHGFETHQN
ncbi:hypothetical protein EV702DRAFT_1049429 [Suillus placidus]|uniref:Uncharacterized protein n=1 Tax=Suillus placidus TaxID=48579 RepID=A0A9P6ZKK8_9AGAM|nr:hypothetical protein EV702DRAFT_1049429 [Suillus placidus]